MKTTDLFPIKFTMLFLLFAVTYLTSTAQDSDETKGDLVFLISDFVAPSDMGEYETWIKQFKKLADETNAPDYFVNFNGSTMNFGRIIGKDMSGLDELNEAWEKWSKANPKEVYGKELLSKYSTTRMWRMNPTDSYMPEEYDDSIERPYVRIEKNYILSGQVGKAKEIIAEYKAEWAKQKISYRVLSAWNLFGEEQACVQFVSWYKDKKDWLASQDEVMKKVGEAKLTELDSKWDSVLRKKEEMEVISRPDLSHSNN